MDKWVQVTAKCQNKNEENITVDQCEVSWNGSDFDISKDGQNSLEEKADEYDYVTAEIEGNVFYIKRIGKRETYLNIELREKNPGYSSSDDDDEISEYNYLSYMYVIFDSLIVPENDYIENPTEEKEEAENNELTLGTPEYVTGNAKWFSFTPENDGNYKFIFECEDDKWTNNLDALYLYIEKKDGLHKIDQTYEISMRHYLKGGTTYYLCAGYTEDEDYSDDEWYSTEYTVTVVKVIDGLTVFCNNEELNGNDNDYVLTCEIGGTAVLKVADSDGASIDGAAYKWYEWSFDGESEGYTLIEDVVEAEYRFQYSSYREIKCEVEKDGTKEEIYFRPICKNHRIEKDTVPSTCLEQGYEEEWCSFCHWWLGERTLPLAGHTGTWTNAGAATVFSPAKQTRKCTVCGKVESRTVGNKLAATITPNASSVPLKVKQSTKKFQVTLAAGDSVASWTSSNKKIATVSGKANGTCTIKAGKKTGTAKITIKTAAGATKTIKVKVQKGKVKTSSVKNVPKKITIKKGQSYKLSPSIQPLTSTDKAKYSSKNKKIAAVSGKGVIKGKKAGKTKITVKAGSKKFTCRVVVTK